MFVFPGVFFFFLMRSFIYSFLFLYLHGVFLLCMSDEPCDERWALWLARATLCCGMGFSHCSGFSCFRAQALYTWASVIVVPRFQSRGSKATAHGLSCFLACGIFLNQGLNPCPPHWQVDSYALHHQGSSPELLLKGSIMICLKLASSVGCPLQCRDC